jgi:hypothetical protein
MEETPGFDSQPQNSTCCTISFCWLEVRVTNCMGQALYFQIQLGCVFTGNGLQRQEQSESNGERLWSRNLANKWGFIRPQTLSIKSAPFWPSSLRSREHSSGEISLTSELFNFLSSSMEWQHEVVDLRTRSINLVW